MNQRSISFTVGDCSSSSELSWFQSKVSSESYDSDASNRSFEGVKVLQSAIANPGRQVWVLRLTENQQSRGEA
eukprot:12887177-Prorocentrum_lima.AAC.1